MRHRLRPFSVCPLSFHPLAHRQPITMAHGPKSQGMGCEKKEVSDTAVTLALNIFDADPRMGAAARRVGKMEVQNLVCCQLRWLSTGSTTLGTDTM